VKVGDSDILHEDDADEEWVEDEGDSSDDLLACPSCRRPVHEDTQCCPHCGDWIIPVHAGARRTRMVWTVVAAMVIIALVIALVF